MCVCVCVCVCVWFCFVCIAFVVVVCLFAIHLCISLFLKCCEHALCMFKKKERSFLHFCYYCFIGDDISLRRKTEKLGQFCCTWGGGGQLKNRKSAVPVRPFSFVLGAKLANIPS